MLPEASGKPSGRPPEGSGILPESSREAPGRPPGCLREPTGRPPGSAGSPPEAFGRLSESPGRPPGGPREAPEVLPCVPSSSTALHTNTTLRRTRKPEQCPTSSWRRNKATLAAQRFGPRRGPAFNVRRRRRGLRHLKPKLIKPFRKPLGASPPHLLKGFPAAARSRPDSPNDRLSIKS